MVALSRAAGVVVDGGLRRGAAGAWLVVGGVAHAWCGEFGEDGVEGGPGFGGEVSADCAHAVDVLAPDGDAAALGTVDVGEVPVGVQAVGELVGQLAQLVGAMLACEPGQLRLGLLTGLDVDEVGEPMEEPTNYRDMAGPDGPVSLCLGGDRQHRWQRFAVQSPALAEVFG